MKYIFSPYAAQGGENTMASKTKKARLIRKWKDKPNKSNQKTDEKRLQKNREILKELAAADRA